MYIEKTYALYLFVRSLSPLEVRRINKYGNVFGGEPKHLRLFNYLSNLEVYDYEKLKKEFADANLSRIKNYLHRFLLKAMRALGFETHAELKDLRGCIDIAVQRRDKVMALRMINEAEAIAAEREMFSDHRELLLLERSLLLTNPTLLAQNPKRLIHITDTLVHVKEQRDNFEEFTELETLVTLPRALAEKGNAAFEDGFLHRLSLHEFMINPARRNSKRAGFKYHWLRSYIAVHESDWETAIRHSEEILRIFEDNSWMIQESFERYFNEIKQLSIYCLICGEYDRGLELLRKLREYKLDKPLIRIYLLDKLVLSQFSYAFYLDKIELGREAVGLVDEYLEFVEPFIAEEQLLLIMYAMARHLILEKNYELAHSWVQKIIHFEKGDLQPSVQVHARVLHLVVLFWQKEWRSLESHGRNYTRYLKVRQSDYPIAYEVTKMLKNSQKYLENGRIREKLHEILISIKALAAKGEEPMATNFFDFPKWIKQLIREFED